MCSCFISSTRFLQPDYKFFEGRELFIYTSWSSYSICHIDLNIPGCQYNYLSLHIPVSDIITWLAKNISKFDILLEIFRAFLDHTCCFLPPTHPQPQPPPLASSCFTFSYHCTFSDITSPSPSLFSLILSFLFESIFWSLLLRFKLHETRLDHAHHSIHLEPRPMSGTQWSYWTTELTPQYSGAYWKQLKETKLLHMIYL